MKKIILIICIFTIISCAFNGEKKVFYLPYQFVDPNLPAISLKFPYKTSLIISGIDKQEIYSCKYYDFKSNGNYKVKLNKCFFNEDFLEYNIPENEIKRLKSKYFNTTDDNKTLSISSYSTNRGFGLKSKIYYLVDKQNLIKIIITKEYVDYSSINNEIDWIKKNPNIYESFKTYSLYLYNGLNIKTKENSKK